MSNLIDKCLRLVITINWVAAEDAEKERIHHFRITLPDHKPFCFVDRPSQTLTAPVCKLPTILPLPLIFNF